jgi:hypothetical protein
MFPCLLKNIFQKAKKKITERNEVKNDDEEEKNEYGKVYFTVLKSKKDES